MIIDQIIYGLNYEIGMLLFNPLTGESKTPEQLNESDRASYNVYVAAIEALGTQEPKPPIVKENSYGWKFYYCPSCGKEFYQNNKFKFCEKCGQAVKWDDAQRSC